MTITAQQIEQARMMIMDVLSGRATPETDPAWFTDDLLFFNIRMMESEDGEWLLTQLSNQQYPMAARLFLVGELNLLQNVALKILVREDPTIMHTTDDPEQI